MERILMKWQHFLDSYTDIELTSKRSLIISLLVAIVGLALGIYILNIPPFLPGTIWVERNINEINYYRKPRRNQQAY